MRRIATILILSLAFLSGTGIAMADKHNNHHGNNKGSQHSSQYYGPREHEMHGNRQDKRYDKDFKQFRKDEKKYWKERAKMDKRYHHDIDRQLRSMVAYSTRGAKDVRVWQINGDTFIVRYFKGGRYYVQRIYPYTNRYGAASVVNLNWNPLSSWTLLPSLSINIY